MFVPAAMHAPDVTERLTLWKAEWRRRRINVEEEEEVMVDCGIPQHSEASKSTTAAGRGTLKEPPSGFLMDRKLVTAPRPPPHFPSYTAMFQAGTDGKCQPVLREASKKEDRRSTSLSRILGSRGWWECDDDVGRGPHCSEGRWQSQTEKEVDKEDKEDKKDVKWLVGVGNKKGYPFIRKRFSPFFCFFNAFVKVHLSPSTSLYIYRWLAGRKQRLTECSIVNSAERFQAGG